MSSFQQPSSLSTSYPRGWLTMGGLMSADEPQSYTQSPHVRLVRNQEGIDITPGRFSNNFFESRSRVDTPHTASWATPGAFGAQEVKPESFSAASDAFFGSYKRSFQDLSRKNTIDEQDPEQDVNFKEYDGPRVPLLKGVKFEKSKKETHLLRSLSSQAINAVVAIPLLLTLAAIVYQHPFYAKNMGILSKHLFFASAIYQIVFSIRSALPFAVGQVQDVGLIFLSAMAYGIAEMGEEKNIEPLDIIGAVIVLFMISTMIVGLATFLTGIFKFAEKMQYIPLPVVGGYLAYVGYFCISAGLALSAGVKRCDEISCYTALFDFNGGLNCKFTRLIIGIICSIIVRFVMAKYPSSKYPLALPGILILIPSVFYIALYSLGFTLEEARNTGWVRMPYDISELQNSWDIWIVVWDNKQNFGDRLALMRPQMMTIIPLFIIVAFGSAMDIAAVQQDYSEDVDFNKELVTVGSSNFLAGLLGAGYTGSYIFSQCLLALRTGVDNRWGGLLIAAVELLIFFVPFSPVNYLPDFYFGSLETFIGFDIAVDWIYHSYKKMTLPEYIILMGTFIGVFFTDLCWGMLGGLCVSALYFSYSYAKVNATASSIRGIRRNTVRPLQHLQALNLFQGNVLAFELEGFIFFGSSITIIAKIRELAEKMPLVYNVQQNLNLEALGEEEGESLRNLVYSAPRFVILDFENVQDIDATGARAILMLCVALNDKFITPILTRVQESRPHIKRMLKSYNVISDDPNFGFPNFSFLSRALEFCETQFLSLAVKANLISEAKEAITLTQVLESYLGVSRTMPFYSNNFDTLAKKLAEYFVQMEYEKDSVVFKIGDVSDKLYIILSGYINIKLDKSGGMQDSSTDTTIDIHAIEKQDYEYGPGGVFGHVDFFMECNRTSDAVCSEKAVLMILTKDSFIKIRNNDSQLTNTLQAMIMMASFLKTRFTNGRIRL